MLKLNLCGAGRILLLCLTGAGTASFGQMVYLGLTPGQSTQEQVNTALGRPVRQIGRNTFEYAPQQGTGRIEVDFVDGVADQIQVFFAQPVARATLVERVLQNRAPETKRLDPAGTLYEFFGEPLFAALTYPAGDVSRGAASIFYYSRKVYDVMTGKAPMTGAAAQAPVAPVAGVAPASVAGPVGTPLDNAPSAEFRVRLLTPVSTRSARQGDRIAAEVLSPASYVGDLIDGVVTEAKSSGGTGGASALAIMFAMFHHRQDVIPVRAEIQSVVNSRGARNVDEEGWTVTPSSALPATMAMGGEGAAPVAISQLATNGPAVSLATGSELVLRVSGVEQERTVTQPSPQPAGGTAAQSRTPVNINVQLGFPGLPGRVPGATPQGGTLPSQPLPRSSLSTQTFTRPAANGTRVDRCLHWGADCGQPAADFFCRSAGFANAISFQTEPASPTWVMGDNRPCEGGFCNAFSRIDCGAAQGSLPAAQTNISFPPIGGSTTGSTTSSAPIGTASSLSIRNLALNRPTLESSTYNGSPRDPALGVDGNPGNFFATREERNPWWQVDLGANFALTEVRIFNRTDCCSERARTIRVLLSTDGGTWQTVYSHNGSTFGGDGRPLVVPLSGRTARYVRLQLAEDSIAMNIAEVEVYGQDSGVAVPADSGWGNLALHRPTRQSSVYQKAAGNDSQQAVDGRLDDMFHTEEEMSPWWQVDLGAPSVLSEIRVFNRQDCCSERARTIRILLSQDGGSWQTVYSHDGTIFGGGDGRPLVVQMNSRTARFVRLQLAEKIAFHLLEVEVYGVPASANASIPAIGSITGSPASPSPSSTRNLALNRPTRESSIYNDNPGDSAWGVDGSPQNFFGTKLERNPWWQVDLGANYALSEVRIFNRMDCCTERARTLRVLLSADGGAWQTVYTHNGSVFGGADARPLVVPLSGRTARYVRLQLGEENILNIAEVEVYGQESGAGTPSASSMPTTAGTSVGVAVGTTTLGGGDQTGGGSGQYLGCFKESGDVYSERGRMLDGAMWRDEKAMTTQSCVAFCRGRGFAYAGTEYSSQCYCGNSYGKFGPASNCDMPCSGDKAQTCGGSWAGSVYSVK